MSSPSCSAPSPIAGWSRSPVPAASARAGCWPRPTTRAPTDDDLGYVDLVGGDELQPGANLCDAIAAAFGVRLPDRSAPLEDLADAFGGRTPRCSSTRPSGPRRPPRTCSASCCARCPGLRVCVTSRRSLDLSGQRNRRRSAPGLPEPDASPEQARATPAVRLLLDRLLDRSPGPRARPTVTWCCSAGWRGRSTACRWPSSCSPGRPSIRSLAELDVGCARALASLDLTGEQDRPERHRSLRDTVLWSADALLPEAPARGAAPRSASSAGASTPRGRRGRRTGVHDVPSAMRALSRDALVQVSRRTLRSSDAPAADRARPGSGGPRGRPASSRRPVPGTGGGTPTAGAAPRVATSCSSTCARTTPTSSRRCAPRWRTATPMPRRRRGHRPGPLLGVHRDGRPRGCAGSTRSSPATCSPTPSGPGCCVMRAVLSLHQSTPTPRAGPRGGPAGARGGRDSPWLVTVHANLALRTGLSREGGSTRVAVHAARRAPRAGDLRPHARPTPLSGLALIESIHAPARLPSRSIRLAARGRLWVGRDAGDGGQQPVPRRGPARRARDAAEPCVDRRSTARVAPTKSRCS